MKIIIANSIGKDNQGNHIIHFPSRWTASVGKGKKPFTFYPYQLAYLSSLLKQKTRHEIKLIDGNLQQLALEKYKKVLACEKPDYLIMEPATLTYKEDLQLSLYLKNKFKTKIIFTGPHASVFPQQVLENGVDYVVLGEYENTVLEIIRNPAKKNIPGLFPNKNNRLLDVHKLPLPEDQDISRYDYIGIDGSDYREIEMFGSRGCPMKCVFCVASNVYYPRPNFRPRSPKNIVQEMIYLSKKYPQMQGVFFNEEYHNANKKFILELCREIKRKNLKLKINAMCGYWTIDEEMLKEMKSAGYYKLRIGIETSSKITAKAINKNIDIKKLKQILKLAQKIGIKMYGTFTFGAPGSTWKEDLKTVNLIKNLLDNDLLADLQLSICTPQPGTPFYNFVQKNNYLTTSNWREFDGASCSVVSYPNYSKKEIETMFLLAGKVVASCYKNRIIKNRGWQKFLKDKIYQEGVIKTFFKGIGKLKRDWQVKSFLES